jgi:hypothetical protein
VRSIVDSLSLLGVIAVVIGVGMIVALLSWCLVGRRSRPLEGYSAAAGTVRDAFGIFFGLVLALSIGSVASRGRDALTATSLEATAVAQLTRGVRSFPIEDRAALRAAINAYVHAVADDEFATMRRGRTSPLATAALDDLYGTYQTIQARPGVEGSEATRELSKLEAITERRRARVGLVSSGLPGLLLGFLGVGFVLFVALLYPAGLSSGLTRSLISGATASVIAFALMLTIVLDYPFSGPLRIAPTNYKLAPLSHFWISERPPSISPMAIMRLTAGDLVGEWQSDSFFNVIVFRRVGDDIIAAYRRSRGTINGSITTTGAFRGIWCQEPLRRPPNAGVVEFRLLRSRTVDGRLFMTGRWRIGSHGRIRGGWNLTKIGDRRPIDLNERLRQPTTLCSSQSLRRSRK